MAASDGLHALQNGFEHLLELRRAEQQLIDFAKCFERAELFFETRAQMLNVRTSVARLIRRGDVQPFEAALRERPQALLDRSQRRHMPAHEVLAPSQATISAEAHP